MENHGKRFFLFEGSAFSLSHLWTFRWYIRFFLAEYVRRFGSNLCIVVPTEKEIEELRADLDIAGLQAQVLPWWGNMAYRPVQNSAPVFAERAQMLAELCAGSPVSDSVASGAAANTVTVMTQRAFLTPVPPPDYLKTLTCTLYKGKEIDTEKIASLLVQWGYTRVPRVSVGVNLHSAERCSMSALPPIRARSTPPTVFSSILTP